MDIFKLPNLFSISRIFLMVPVILFYSNYQDTKAASDLVFCIFFMFVSALTDYLDGYLARKQNSTSELGKILDPISDKICIISFLIVLYLFDKVPLWFLSLVVARDLFILIGAFLLMEKTKRVPSSEWAGKITAFLFALLLFSYALEINSIQNILIFSCVLSMSYSLLDYLLKYIKLSQRTKA